MLYALEGVEGDVAIVRRDVAVEPGVMASDGLLRDGTMLDPDGEETVMLMFPVRPRLPIVKVEVAELLATILAGFEGEAVTVKSERTVKVIEAVCVSMPLLPVTTTV